MKGLDVTQYYCHGINGVYGGLYDSLWNQEFINKQKTIDESIKAAILNELNKNNPYWNPEYISTGNKLSKMFEPLMGSEQDILWGYYRLIRIL